ncbi:hypothetical protein [Rosettibacter firmus]|uniref:hypothetical protein n=1 Tax=Rosettibacter firmus TaxID=3111522 RepID=UPI00336BDB93
MKWFSIFKTGKHTDSSGNTREWTEADLDKIVENYDPKKHEAPIVIGHPKTNAPAFGWIEKLKRVGDTLYALPKQLANEFVEMVNKGLFKKRSISLYPDGTLRHVGFLGAQPPAVKGLPDVEFKDEDNFSSIETEGNIDLEESNTPDPSRRDGFPKKGDNNTPPEGMDSHEFSKREEYIELKTKLKQYEEQLKKLDQKEKEFEELQTKYTQLLVEKSALEKEIEKQKRETQLKEFAEKVDKAIADGKLLPKMKDTMTKLFEVVSLTPVYEFSEGVKTKTSELLIDLINSMPKLIDFEETKNNQKKNDIPVSKILAEEIRKNMK